MNNASSRSHSECKCENECECVSVNVNVSVDRMRHFRYLLHFRQGAWQGRTADQSISAAQRRVRMHLLATLAATTNLLYPNPLPLPFLSPLPSGSRRFCFQFPQSILPN